MKKVDEESRLDRIERGLELLLQGTSELRESQNRTDAQISELRESQKKTDEHSTRPMHRSQGRPKSCLKKQ